jgi:hypothetical protein
MMIRILGILLIGLLGFLGCSGSNDGTSTTSNTVGEAIPVAPWAIIETSTPTYEWTPVPGATRYRLLVQETTQAATIQDTNETSIIDEWYTAEEVGCASEDGLCMVTPDIEVFEEYTWKVQACANEECGSWSEPLDFKLTPPASAGAPRFTDNEDGTVTDNATKLMWSKNANVFSLTYTWQTAVDICKGVALGDHYDWRLPSLSELESLIDKGQSHPALPPGNPFMNVQSDYYWSSSTHDWDVGSAWGVDVGSGSESYMPEPFTWEYVWPVRSGN